MGSATIKTFKRLVRDGQPNELSEERIVKFIESGAYDLAVDHPDYRVLAQQLRGEPVIRRAKALDLETCGVKLDPPFDGARIWTDVYGEGDGSFDLTTVESLPLDASLGLEEGLDALMSRRAKFSQGARRMCWFVKNANAGTLPPQMQKLVDQWRTEYKAIFFADTTWLDVDGIVNIGYAYARRGIWLKHWLWSSRTVGDGCCVLVSKETRD